MRFRKQIVMALGMIFDIKEFAIYDGPGIRTTVFFKGCPLRCMWCHNPEGLSFKKELMVSKAACQKCGKCLDVCEKGSSECRVCGRCVPVCPANIRRIAGTDYEAGELAEKLLKNRDFLISNNGGITISGGEPLAQPEFLFELLSGLESVHRIIQTSGYSGLDIFKLAVEHSDMILFDLKHSDSEIHKQITGVDNKKILRNLNYLVKSSRDFILRIPLIPGVNDSEKNMKHIAKLIKDADNLKEINLLPYHKTAGAKYTMVGRAYSPSFDENKEPLVHEGPFVTIGKKVRQL